MSEVVVVAADLTFGNQLVTRLNEAGHEVTWCPGPRKPTFVCIGGRGRRCPLAAAADVVVVDGWLRSDEAMCGTPSWHLVQYYIGLGVPVVAIVGPNGLPGPLPDGDVIAVQRSAGCRAVVEAVDRVTSSSCRPSGSEVPAAAGSAG